MAKRCHLSSHLISAQANVLAEMASGGFIDIFDGRQPASPDDEITTQNFMAQFNLEVPAFLPAVDGRIELVAVKPTATVRAGDLTWARIFAADHTTALMDISVASGDANMNFEKTKDVQAGTWLVIGEFFHTIAPRSPGY